VLPREAPPAGRADRHVAGALSVRTLLTLAAAALFALAAGCGDDDAPGDPGQSPGDASDLTVTLDAGPGGTPPEVADVRCPGGGPQTAACEAVDALPEDAAAPVPAGAVCTQIYGGPDVVRIEGTLRGKEVDTELTRANGCEIERFDHFLPLLRTLFESYRPGQAGA
jgi:hypothetical protein